MGPELCFLIPSYLAMKKIALALCSAVTALMSQGVSAHGMTQNDLMNLTEAYAYVYQRQQVLAAAEKQFGNDVGVLGVVDTSRLTWNLIYPDAENALITHLGHFGLSRADIAKLTAETLGASDKNLRFRDAIQAKAVVLHYSLVSKSPTEKENRSAGHYRMPPSRPTRKKSLRSIGQRTKSNIRFGIPRVRKNSES